MPRNNAVAINWNSIYDDYIETTHSPEDYLNNWANATTDINTYWRTSTERVTAYNDLSWEPLYTSYSGTVSSHPVYSSYSYITDVNDHYIPQFSFSFNFTKHIKQIEIE